MYYWRTSHGSEVDLVIETQSGLVPLEIKQTETPRPEMAKGIVSFRDDFGKKAAPGYVIFPGEVILPLAENVSSLPLVRL
jgi:predicted AAA+ superfamily ATPase